MKENRMAAILFVADFDAKDALLALDAAYSQGPSLCVSALKYAGYRSADIGQGLRAAFQHGEPAIASAFLSAGCSSEDALQAVCGAYGADLAVAAVLVEEAGYPAGEVADVLLKAQRASGRRALGAGRESAVPDVKIFVYDVPEDLLYLKRKSITNGYLQRVHDFSGDLPIRLDLSRQELARRFFSQTGNKDWTQQYGYEFVLYEGLKSSPVTTRDPEEADFFLIPNFTTTIFARLLSNVEHLGFDSFPFTKVHFPEILKIADRYFNSILDHIRSQHPYFDRSGGRDHLMVCTWDNGLGIAEKKTALGYNVTHMFMDETKKKLRNVVPITYHASRASRYFKSHPCIVIPPFVNDHVVRRVRADPRSRNFSEEQRKQLSFFLGSSSHHPMRETYESCYRDDEDMLVNTPEMKTGDFESIKWSSLFSICMEGYTPWTMRLTQAFLYGCIPVIVSDNVILPFERFIDWTECSLRVTARKIPHLKSILQGLGREEITRLRNGFVKHAPAIVLDSQRGVFEQRLGSLILEELGLLKARREGRPATRFGHGARGNGHSAFEMPFPGP